MGYLLPLSPGPVDGATLFLLNAVIVHRVLGHNCMLVAGSIIK